MQAVFIIARRFAEKWLSGPIAKATLGTSVILGVKLVAQALILIVLARLLGAEQFGGYAAVVALAVLMGSLTTLGTHLVLLESVSCDSSTGRSVTVYAIPTTLFAGAVLLGAFMLLVHALFHSQGLPQLVILAFGLAEILFQPLIVLASVEHQAQGRTAYSQWLIAMPLILRTGIAVLVMVVDPPAPLTLFAFGYLLTTVVALVAALRLLASPWPKWSSWRRPTVAEFRHSSGFAVLNLTALGPSEADKTLAFKLLPHGAAGVYAVATRVIGALVLPVMAMLISALPRLFRQNQSKNDNGGSLIALVFSISLGYGVAIALVLWLFAPAFAVIFGNEFAAITDMLRWLALAVPGLTLRVSAGAVLVSQGKPWVRARFEAIGLITLLVSALLLASTSETAGMPMALVITEWSMAIFGWRLVRKCVHARQESFSQHGGNQ